MRILYLGADDGTSGHRANALVRLGNRVRIVNPASYLPRVPFSGKWAFETGGLLVAGIASQAVLDATAGDSYDMVWVDAGELVTGRLIRTLRARHGPVLNYNHDDPFGRRDRLRWRQYIRAVRDYDLLVVVRQCNVEEAYKAGAKKVLHVFRASDEVAHAPRDLAGPDWEKWRSDVAFVGTWMPERGPFLLELAVRGVPLRIYGDRWNKCPEWPVLKRYWHSPNLHPSDEYAKAVQCAKLCLGLLSKGNRDLHTTRSLEIPQLGSVLVAERTPEHQAMYLDGEEAVFWSNADECAEKCRLLLTDETLRVSIAAAGRRRAIANGHFNERLAARIMQALQGSR